MKFSVSILFATVTICGPSLAADRPEFAEVHPTAKTYQARLPPPFNDTEIVVRQTDEGRVVGVSALWDGQVTSLEFDDETLKNITAFSDVSISYTEGTAVIDCFRVISEFGMPEGFRVNGNFNTYRNYLIVEFCNAGGTKYEIQDVIGLSREIEEEQRLLDATIKSSADESEGVWEGILNIFR